MNTIQERIDRLKAEQSELNQVHDKMVAEFQEATREFQQKVATNQGRYQQIVGGIAELKRILSEEDKTQETIREIRNEQHPNPRSHTQHRTAVD